MKDFNALDIGFTMGFLGYPIDKRINALNIIGIRSNRSLPNQFDDLICLMIFGSGVDPLLYKIKATTDPGLFYLNNPLSKNGTAFLCPGHYNNVWALDLHRGKYKALCQRLGPMRVFRDNDKDDISEKTEFIETGFFGINLHRASRISILNKIDKFSAGCQVIQDPAAFDMLIRLAEIHVKEWGNRFSYTLLEEDQLLNA